MTEALEGNVVSLRLMTEEDVPAVLTLLQEPEVERWWNRWDADRVRKQLLENDEAVRYVIHRDGQTVGIIQYYEEDDPEYRHAGMDISVHPSVFGTGVALDALRTLARHLIDDRCHHRLVIDPNAANARAIACYRKLGFRDVGIMRRYEQNLHGEWTDGLLMDLLADELT